MCVCVCVACVHPFYLLISLQYFNIIFLIDILSMEGGGGEPVLFSSRDCVSPLFRSNSWVCVCVPLIFFFFSFPCQETWFFTSLFFFCWKNIRLFRKSLTCPTFQKYKKNRAISVLPYKIPIEKLSFFF